jgi:hypothetical protein
VDAPRHREHGITIMSRTAHFAIAAVSLMWTAATADATPLSSAVGSPNATGALLSKPIHLKPGNHCHPHGRSKLCHGANDYPALYPRADRAPQPGHRHTRICQH